MSAWRTYVWNFNVMITSDRVLRLVKQQNRGGNCLSFNLVDIVCLSAALLRREGQLLDTNRFPALPSDIFNHNMVSIEEKKNKIGCNIGIDLYIVWLPLELFGTRNFFYWTNTAVQMLIGIDIVKEKLVRVKQYSTVLPSNERYPLFWCSLLYRRGVRGGIRDHCWVIKATLSRDFSEMTRRPGTAGGRPKSAGTGGGLQTTFTFIRLIFQF